MDRTVTTQIDAARCIGCGACVRVCPSRTLSMQEGKAAVTGDQSLSCGHCAAVCPVEAIHIAAIDDRSLSFQTFRMDPAWLPHGQPDPAALVRLMASRRSCRNYLERPVTRAVLEDLVRIGTMAPSGSNSQSWTFTILPTRQSLLVLGNQVYGFFRRLNRLAERTILRNTLKWIGKAELDWYHRNYYASVEEGIGEWKKGGTDRLFHGATAALVIGARPGGSCPSEDALLATQNILLAAHSMGLGSCLIGFAVEAMRKRPDIKRAIGIPPEETVHAVIALGHPDESYLTLAGRKPYVQRYAEAGVKENKKSGGL